MVFRDGMNMMWYNKSVSSQVLTILRLMAIFRSNKQWYKKWWGILLMVVVGSCVAFTLFFIALIVYFFVQVKEEAKFYEEISQFESADRELVETRDDPFTGNENAEFVIVEFADFQCEFCKEEFFVLNDVMEKYHDRVKLIFRDFPVEQTHPHARTAALAANCAHEQGKFWALHDPFFLNQSDLSDQAITRYAQIAKLNMPSFETCLATKKFDSEIDTDLVDGLSAGVSATPTFYINGLKAQGTVPFVYWERLIKDFYGEE